MIATASDALIGRPGVRQFIKFCIVGASSFAVDLTTAFIIYHYLHVPVLIAKTISFTLAVTNGFIWNSRWTFRGAEGRRQRDQYAMFYAVNLVGLVLNLAIFSLFVGMVSGKWFDPHPSKLLFLGATLVATAFVTFWNFFANKHWTFK